MKRLILICAICMCTYNFNAQVIEKDSIALVSFYQSLGGDNWYNNTNWLTDKPVGEWHGVYVDNNRVFEISLSDNNLVGSIPSTIGNLDGLTSIGLSNEEKLTGTIPTELGNCTRLESINIIVTGISGQIPSSFSALSNLHTITLYRNKLEGTFPTFLLDLPLEQLDINDNNFTGNIPSEISKLKQIRLLSLSRNNFSGVVPPEVSQLKNLSAFHINENSLEGDVELWLKDLPQLYYITIGNNQFTGTIKASMFNPDSIRLLDFPNSDINYLENLESLNNLERVNCGGTKLNFSDLDRNKSIIQHFQLYDMQRRLTKDSITVKEGEELVIFSDVDGKNTEYKWYKFNVEIDGATSKNFTIPSVGKDDEGWYAGEGLNYGISIRREAVYLTVGNETRNYESAPLEVTVFPNPTAQSIHVRGQINTIAYEIFSSTGFLIEKGNVENEKIDLAGIERGHYIIVLSDGIKRKVSHVMKL